MSKKRIDSIKITFKNDQIICSVAGDLCYLSDDDKNKIVAILQNQRAFARLERNHREQVKYPEP